MEPFHKGRKKSKDKEVKDDNRWELAEERANSHVEMALKVGGATRSHDIFLGGLVREKKTKRVCKPFLLKGF